MGLLPTFPGVNSDSGLLYRDDIGEIERFNCGGGGDILRAESASAEGRDTRREGGNSKREHRTPTPYLGFECE